MAPSNTWQSAASHARPETMNFDPEWAKNLPAARYCTDLPSFYQGVPTVEAMGPILDMKAALDAIGWDPPDALTCDFSAPAEHRLHALPFLEEMVTALPFHHALYLSISSNARHRLLKIDEFRRRQLVYSLPDEGVTFTECSEQKVNLDICEEQPAKNFQTNKLRSPAAAILVLGPSGSGKGVAIESCLGTFPYQACFHSEYKGRQLNYAQILWSKLDCSFDTSLHGIANELFASLDAPLGTNYFEEFSKGHMNIDTKLLFWQRLALKHNLAILWVDEINCLRVESESLRLLNFFLKVSNLLGITIIFSGTSAAAKLFSRTLHNARRSCSGGAYEITPYIQDEIWDRIVFRRLLRYQWIKHPAAYNQDLSNKLLNLSAGIHHVVVLLWILAQSDAIQGGRESITVEALDDVYQRHLGPLHAALAALRSKKRKKLAIYEDLLPAHSVMQEMMKRALRNYEAAAACLEAE